MPPESSSITGTPPIGAHYFVPESDSAIAERLRQFNVPDTPDQIDFYKRAADLGKKGIVPASDWDLTHMAFQRPAHKIALSLFPGVADFFFNSFGIPLSWRDGATNPIHNSWYYGRRAFLMGMADGSGKPLPLDTRGYPFRVASIAYDHPDFAHSVLGLSTDEYARLRGMDRSLAIAELEGRVRKSPHIFTWESLEESARRTFAQYQENPAKMTWAQWLAALTHTKDPGSSKTKQWWMHETAGKPDVAKASREVGNIDDREGVGTRVTMPEAEGRALIQTNPEVIKHEIEPGLYDNPEIEARLAEGTKTNSTELLIAGLEEMNSKPKGQGADSTVVLPLPDPIEPQYDVGRDAYVMPQPATPFLRQWFMSRYNCLEIMTRAHLDGRHPSGFFGKVGYSLTKGGLSSAELGFSTYAAKALTHDEINWDQVGPDTGIYAGVGFMGAALMGNQKYYRGGPANFAIGLTGATAVDIYEGRPVSVGSVTTNTAGAGLFAGLHFLVQKLAQTTIVKTLGAQAIKAQIAGDVGKAGLLTMGLRFGTYALSAGATTLFSAGVEWWSRSSRVDSYDQFQNTTTRIVFDKYLDYKLKAVAITSSANPTSDAIENYKEAYQNLSDTLASPDVALFIQAADFPDIEGQEFMEAVATDADSQRQIREETDTFLRTLYEQGVSPVVTDVQPKLEAHMTDSGLIESSHIARSQLSRAQEALEARVFGYSVSHQSDLEKIVDEKLPKLKEVKTLEEAQAIVKDLSGVERTFLFNALLSDVRAEHRITISCFEAEPETTNNNNECVDEETKTGK